MINYSDSLLFKIDEYIEKMPSLPVSVSKVMEICNNANANPNDLNHVISLDPVLTGRLLKLINSAFYGLSNHVTSIVRAIIMLGINTVKNLTLSTAVLGALPQNKVHHGMDMEKFWCHSLCTGVTAKILSGRQGIDTTLRDEYFVAGLLHDIGKIPLNAILAADYVPALCAEEDAQKPFYEIETEKLQLNHCTTGEMIAKAWQLASPVYDIITHHHDACAYSGEYANIINNVVIANYFSSFYQIGFSGEKNPVKPDQKIWDACGFHENIFEEIRGNVSLEIEKAKVFLKR
jgi:HD-like signal output (HDOD) protein